MGLWEHVSSITDLKRLSSVKDLCGSSYDYSRNAVAKIHSAVTGTAVAQKLYEHLTDEETTSKIASNFANVAVKEGLKFVPGGPTVYDIVSRSLNNDKNSKRNRDLLELKNKVDRLEKEVRDFRKLLEQTETHKPVEN